jgi:hypothetical protein
VKEAGILDTTGTGGNVCKIGKVVADAKVTAACGKASGFDQHLDTDCTT